MFKQNPTYEDCFPSSTKEYKEVVHEATGSVLRVSLCFRLVGSACGCACIAARARRLSPARPMAALAVSMQGEGGG